MQIVYIDRVRKLRLAALFLTPLLFSVFGQAAPFISSFWPMVGASNDFDFITISGSGFFVSGSPPSVKFNGVESFPAAAVGDTFGTNISAHVAPGTPLGQGRIVVTVNGASTQSGSFFTVIGPQQPYVTNFIPIAGSVGTPVQLFGVHFFNGSLANQINTVRFNGVAATSFTVVSDNEVDVIVPSGAGTGPITVISTGGTFSTMSNIVSAATNFFVPPVITSFSPTAGRANTNVVITGSNFLFTTSVTFNGLAASFTPPTNNTTLRVVVPTGATTGKITVNTPANNPFTSTTNFVVQPTIFDFSPSAGIAGTTVVTVNGANFDAGGFSVKFGEVNASTYSTPTFSQFTVTVPAGATNAPITVTTVDGSNTTAQLFYLPPVITGFSPTNSAPGTTVNLTGQNLLGTTAVSFNGASAGFTPPTGNTLLQATVPGGLITGPISVTTPGGTTNSNNQFFYGLPMVNSFNPTHGLPGTNVILMGTNFLGTSAVKFNGVSAINFMTVNNGQINVTVPSGVTSGPITVVGSAGNFTTAASFMVDGSDIGSGLSDLPDPVFIGGNLVYTITIINNGPADASNVRITNTLPASVNLISAVTTQGSLNTNANPVLGSLGTINNGGSATVTLTVVPHTTGSITNSVSAGSDFPDANPANNNAQSVTTVWPLPVLSIIPMVNQVEVLWPAPLSNFTLQFVPALSPGFGWSNLGVVPVISGSNSVVTDPNTGTNRFYRLKQ